MNDTSSVPEITLELYRLGELDEPAMASVREALAASPALRERLAALERSDEEILAADPPRVFAAAVEARRRAQPARSAPWWMVPTGATALVVVAAGAVVFLRSGVAIAPPVTDTPGGDRLKGGAPSLLVFRKGERDGERLAPGAVARAHDVLQLAYLAGGHRYGVIVSIDGRGVVTRHHPATGEEAAPLQPQGPTLLATAYRLDDAPQVERFYIVAANAPFSVATVLDAARNASSAALGADHLPLDPALAQASFLLRKE